jgi:hypothetical protein
VDVEDLLDEALIGIERCVEEDERERRRDCYCRRERKPREATTEKPCFQRFQSSIRKSNKA